MSEWQTRLLNLEGLSHDEQLYLEGRLLALGDDSRAACYFKSGEPDSDTIGRLRPLLTETGELRRIVHKRKWHSRLNLASLALLPTGSAAFGSFC